MLINASSDWLKVIIGTVAGFASSVFLEPVHGMLQDARSRRNLRNALYVELAANLAIMLFFLDPANKHQSYFDTVEVYGVQFTTDAYDFGSRQPDVFLTLHEVHYIRDFYGWVRKIMHPHPSEDVYVLMQRASYAVLRNLADGDLDFSALLKAAMPHARKDIQAGMDEYRKRIARAA